MGTPNTKSCCHNLCFSLLSIIISITSNEPWNTKNGSKSTNHRSQTMTFWTRLSKVLFPKRFNKMIDGSEKCKHQLTFELQNSHVFEKYSKSNHRENPRKLLKWAWCQVKGSLRREVTVGYELCKIYQRPNQQTASQIFWDWSFWEALFIFQTSHNVPTFYFTIIYSIFQTNDYNISNPSTQWNITSVDMSTLRTLNTLLQNWDWISHNFKGEAQRFLVAYGIASSVFFKSKWSLWRCTIPHQQREVWFAHSTPTENFYKILAINPLRPKCDQNHHSSNNIKT